MRQWKSEIRTFVDNASVVVNMVSFSLSFEVFHIPAGQVPAERVQLSRTS
jgi:hypothetical protein